MKTQEEIEAMANDFVSLAFSKQDLYDGFINGYFQCQQDMVKKYTEQDMIKFAFDTYYQEDIMLIKIQLCLMVFHLEYL